MAVNCCAPPTATAGPTGLIAMVWSTGITETCNVLDSAPELAVIVTVPPFTPVSRPELLTVARLLADELHVTLARG